MSCDKGISFSFLKKTEDTFLYKSFCLKSFGKNICRYHIQTFSSELLNLSLYGPQAIKKVILTVFIVITMFFLLVIYFLANLCFAYKASLDPVAL